MILLKNILSRCRSIKRHIRYKKFVRRVSQKKDVINKRETVLFWVPGGMTGLLNIECIVGIALGLRGFNVHFVICDGRYLACARRHNYPDVPLSEWPKMCPSCSKQNRDILDFLELDYSFIGDYVSKETEEELFSKSREIAMANYHDISLGEHQLGNNLSSAMTRQTRGGSFDDKEDILKEFAFTVLMVAYASTNAIEKFKPSKVYMSHGVYADWGPAFVVSIASKIPVVSYVACYLPEHFYFGCVKSIEQTFHAVSDSSWEKYKQLVLNYVQEKRLNDFLDNRYKKNISHDMKGLIKTFTDNTDIFYEKYGLDKCKPVWGVMTHINWDSVSDYFPMIYDDFDEWLYETVVNISSVNDIQWLIKIHPSEANDNPDSGAQHLVESRFGKLPPHIKLIKMDDDISPLDFYNLIDGAVTVYGTGGLEVSLMGKPVILAGESHYSKKGFTHDAKDREHYSDLLKNASTIKSLDSEQVRLARNYAYCYFIQKQIPLSPILAEGWAINYDKLEELIPGRNKFVDFLCDRIADGDDFIMDEGLVYLLYKTEESKS